MEKLFSISGSLIFAASIAFVICFYFNVERIDFLLLITGSLMICGKIIALFYFTQGYGLSAKTSPKKNSYSSGSPKISMAVIFVMTPITALAVGLIYLSFTGLSDVSRAYAMVIGCSAIIPLFHWFFHWRNYFFGSEYDARLEFAAKGDSSNLSDMKIKKLREMGVFG